MSKNNGVIVFRNTEKNNHNKEGISIEEAYMEWITENPDGYVLNCASLKNNSGYRAIHKATCRTISRRQDKMSNIPFTGEDYYKVGSLSWLDIFEWNLNNSNKNNTLPKICSKCKPGILFTDFTLEQEILDEEVKKSIKLSEEELRDRLRFKNPKPQKKAVITYQFVRNKDVIALALKTANGKCQNCHKDAPFLKAADGSPFLEVHHKIPLSKNGEDTIENAIALCPNCHRKLHFG